MYVITPATQDDVDRMIGSEANPATREHLRERWRLHTRDEALFLLAKRAGEVVGQTMLLRRSRYPIVENAHNPAEINALHAYVPGQGIGTALIAAAEEYAREWRRPHIGLGVAPDNVGARRLYERLGYQLWSQEQVLDEWTEKDADGNVTAIHRDLCDYLLKPLA
jgi:ribosomal protein S18 acetylase RimI-like enzyme